jgi:hypothetical protein
MTDQLVVHIGHDRAGQTLYLVQFEDENRQMATRIEIGDGAFILLDHLDPELVPALGRSCVRTRLAAA